MAARKVTIAIDAHLLKEIDRQAQRRQDDLRARSAHLAGIRIMPI